MSFAGDVEAYSTAAVIANLKQSKKSKTVLLLDRTSSGAKQVARCLAEAGFGQTFVVQGGFEVRKSLVHPVCGIAHTAGAEARYGLGSQGVHRGTAVGTSIPGFARGSAWAGGRDHTPSRVPPAVERQLHLLTVAVGGTSLDADVREATHVRCRVVAGGCRAGCLPPRGESCKRRRWFSACPPSPPCCPVRLRKRPRPPSNE
jgi:hypothetical protein